MTAIIKLDDPGSVINSLQARINQLEGQLIAQRAWQAKKAADEVKDTIRRLRLHGVVLLELGNTTDVHSELRSCPTLAAAYSETWNLERAPISEDAKAEIRTAANRGMNRW